MHAFGPVVLLDSIAAEQLGPSRTFFNARYLLEAAAEAPIPATKTLGNLSRTFVERASTEMRWPVETAEIVHYVHSALDEPDLPRLHLLRLALENARLLRKYRGSFHATVRGRELMQSGREGELFVALFEAYFIATDLSLLDGYPSDPWLQHGTARILWLLAQAGDEPLRVGELASEIPIDTTRWPDQYHCTGFEHLSAALCHRILRPLEDFGLVDIAQGVRDDVWRGAPARTVQTTDLFEQVVVSAASLN
jgi:hypothetical protein